MFVLTWHCDEGPNLELPQLAGSLAAGTARAVGVEQGRGWQAARLFDRAHAPRARNWSAVQQGGFVVLFAGWIANCHEIAAQLGMSLPEVPHSDDFARLYAVLLNSRLGHPDNLLVGEYAAAALNRDQDCVRLARSPICAPPLWYARVDAHIVASTVPRPIFAAGKRVQLDPVRMADNAWFNYNTDRSSWFEGVERVGLGCVTTIDRSDESTVKYYDICAIKKEAYTDRGELVERAQTLIDEAVRKSTSGFKKPGILLSGGLDSPIVAASILKQAPPEQALPCFTFVPQSDWDGRSPPGTFGDDRPYVEEFARMHPRVQPHYIPNEGKGFDYRLDDLFRVMGIAPINLANYSPYHMPFETARELGCDVLLVPEWGNSTFSAGGEWGKIEYLLTGRWRQLAKALRGLRRDTRPLWRHFVSECVLPLLPHAAWTMQRHLRGVPDIQALASPLRSEFVSGHDLRARSANQGGSVGGPPLRYRSDWIKLAASAAQDEANDIWQGFEQLYGVTKRDPAAYRPLVEFCFSLPTDTYLWNGTDRWLARELARGVLPEEQRRNQLYGRHHADWLARLRPMRATLKEELERLSDLPDLEAMFDFSKMLEALDDFPENTPLGDGALTLQFSMTRAITQARFINFVMGRN